MPVENSPQKSSESPGKTAMNWGRIDGIGLAEGSWAEIRVKRGREGGRTGSDWETKRELRRLTMKLGTETETAKMKKTKEEEEDFDGRKRCHI